MNDTILYGDLIGTADNSQRFGGQTIPEFLNNITCEARFHVDCNSNVKNPDGSEAKPFKTIQQALSCAPIVSCRVNLYVKPGNYDTENLWIDSTACREIFIFGDDAGEVRISNLMVRSCQCLHIENVTFCGKVENETKRTIDVAFSGLTLDNVKFEACEGLENSIVFHASNARLWKCSFSGANRSVYALYGSTINVVDCTFSNNTTNDVVADGSYIALSNGENVKKSAVNGGIVMTPGLAAKLMNME